MDIKKYLQQKAEEDASSVLTEEEKEYCKTIALDSGFQRRDIRHSRKFWACFSCAVCVLLAAIITISVIFAPRKPLMYFDDKIVSQFSTMEVLNGDSKCFSVNRIENSNYEISMSYDSDSGDKLYYEIDIEGIIGNSHIVIVINKNYNYPFKEQDSQPLKEKLIGYELNYYPASQVGFNSTQYTGWIKLKTETVYITFTHSFPYSDDVLFFTYVQSVIQAK